MNAVAGPTAASADRFDEVVFTDARDLRAVRTFVRGRAEAAGLPAPRADLLVLAVSELVTNAVQHAAGPGRVRVWAEHGSVVCEVHDVGPATARMAPAVMPGADSVRGRGLAIVERVCDVVTVLPGASETVVQLRMNW